jgi:hypothetical protein
MNVRRKAAPATIAAVFIVMATTAYAQSAPGGGGSTSPTAPTSGQQSTNPTGLPATANASSGQTVAGATEFFARNRNVSVRERARPGYEAVGIHAGGFYVFPRLTADMQYNDNIYATQNLTASDEIFHVVPELLVKSNWSRHELDLYARAAANEYASHSTESTVDYGFGGSGRLDILRSSNIFAGGSFDRATEPRTSPNAPAAAATPVRYDLAQANIGGVAEFTRLRLSGRVNYSDFDYDNTVTHTGAFLLQKDRNYHQWAESGRAEFAMSPEVSLYLAGDLNQRTYPLQPPVATFNRNSNGYSVGGGSSFDVTRLVRGEAEVGYMRQSYDDPLFGDTSGLYYRIAADWFPTQITTVNLSGTRSIQEAVAISASGYIATTITGRVDHELLRNVLLSAYGSYGQNNYQHADRTDKLAGAGLSGTYLMNQHIGFRLAYDFSKLDSSGTLRIPSYDDNRVTVSITFQL